jgi:gentisate 1,2-dioxygenase
VATALNDNATDVRFIDLAADDVVRPKPWHPLLVSRAAIEEQIARLLDKSVAAGGRRATELVHPQSVEDRHGITPGMSITLNVLRPGEMLSLNRANANRVEFGIGGEAAVLVGERRFDVGKWSTWSIPSMQRRHYKNQARQPFIWLSYSNQPLLDRLGVYYADDLEAAPRRPTASGNEERYVRGNAPDYPILSDGARLRGYEFLTDIEVVENKALVWPWSEVLPHMSQREGDGRRTIMLLYNPATGRRNGTTHSFFATITSFPPGKLRPPPVNGHRHSSFATNYHFVGGGSSIVDGERFHWEAGDLMLSAPSWSEHSHGFAPEGAMVLTVQDHPFQIGIESLIWQERMDGPILTLGSEPGQTGYVGPRLAGD